MARGHRGRKTAKTASAALLAVLLPGMAPGQSLTPEGQTLPVYNQPDEVPQGPDGPALAPTESPDGTARFADGTEASHTPSLAARPGSLRIAGGDGEGAGSPATLLADQVTLGADNRLTASGGVVIWYRGARLIASRVVYDNASGTAVIEGPIHLTEPARAGTPQETILIADSAQLDPNMQDGILRGARLVLAREMQMAAREMRRSENGAVTRLDNVVASSCQICAENPIPLWEIRARAITHDARTQKLHFDRPQFRALGLPIASLPWLTAPDPSVERMTGFLRPQFRTTSGLGFGIKLPYFVTLGDHADVTLTPYVALSRTRTLELRYRQAFSNGAMEWNGAISRDDIEEGETRGYLFGGARFELPRGYMLGLQIQMASNRAYLLDYDISNADRLWSGLTLDRVRRDRMMMARIGNYESLREDEPEEVTPSVVADALWKRRWTPGRIGGIASLEWSLHAHRRASSTDHDGRDMARGSVALDWYRSAILPGGLVGTVETRLDADFYRINQDSDYEDWVMRTDPVLAAELRWPLARHSGGVTHIVEPVAQLVWSPERDAEDKVPNEDSRLIEFDEGNLFALNRFPGWDARESGWRANLGIGWTRIDPAGWSIGLTAGRVFRNKADPAFENDPADPAFWDGGPLGGKRSDWLVSATYQGMNGLALVNRALFDDGFSISRNELRLGWFQPGLQVSAGYLWLDSDKGESRPEDVSELTMAGGWQVAPGWWATTETRYDFTADRAQKAQLGLEYRNECITVEMSVERRFTSSDEVRPDTRFDLGIRLGGFGQQKPGPGTVARRACLR
ncbi:LPS-assembly protein LptD [Paracoccus sp. P2]|uniref:LPS-assembly protein LptD n=1 Tax=Paracoccus pantotrophus TaxID=82367 RepID=A0A7H9BTR8_PARPN|nr:LPS assembly protein LptD [Paracoccus pantotrophus]QLH14804.1 LPS-assembly protein LptD [Paracoccus pantotrophus]RDD99754.1 LPS-assembly protein LptD [Paracoccus pantotrophus]RNI18119.1 LPS-assembly protein LptD [Paracoccus pantotrophus]WGR64946.1 LPS-assembly protein LptD [Paracoccus pantotrophus]